MNSKDKSFEEAVDTYGEDTRTPKHNDYTDD